MRSARESIDKCGIRESLESGDASIVVGLGEGVLGESNAVERRNVVKVSGMDFVR